MPDFRYTAVLPDGRRIFGVIEARDIDDARQSLSAADIKQIRLTASSTGSQPPPIPATPTSPLRSAEDAQQFTEHLAILMQSGLPLAPGLRATAKELANHRLAAAFNRLADHMDAGRSLEESLTQEHDLLPDHIRQLIIAGARSGRLADILVRYVDIQRSWFDLGRNIRLALTYPIVLFATLLGLSAFIALVVVPTMVKIYESFKIRLPLSTRVLLAISGPRILWAIGGIAVAVLMLFVVTRVISPVARRRLSMSVPLFGPMFRWRAVSLWSRMMELLLEQGIPLPTALSVAADGSGDANIAQESRRLAYSVSQGRRLSDSIAGSIQMPPSLVPIVNWGEETGQLPQAFETGATALEHRALLRASLLQIALPPIAFIIIALGAIGLFMSLVAPVIMLITSLSGGGY